MKMDLFKAVRDGDSSSVFRMLLRKQSAVNFTDRNGLSPLFVALVNCRSDVAHCLLDNGAYIDHALPSGLTPLLLCHLLLFPADTFLYRPPSLSRLLAAADRIAELCTTRERRKSEVGRRRDVDVTSWLRRDSEKASSGGEELKATVCDDGDASIRAAGGGTRRDEAAGDERVRRGGATDYVAAASSIDTRSWRSVCSLQLSLSEDIVNKLAEYTSHNCLVSLEQGDFTLDKVQWKAAHISRQRALDNMVDLLLSSGAACDLSGSPLPPLFVPLCCLNVAAVRRLLSAGADANAILDSPTGVLRPLQIACALRTSVAVEIVRMLLDALAHPDCHMTTTRNMDETFLTVGLGSSEEAGHSDGQEGGWTTDHYGDGRLKEGLDLALAACTPLQIACACDGNCENSQKVAQVLLQYGADPNVVSATHGHSALSVAVAHGNQPAVVTLLKAGADPNLQLGCG
ncbi:PREDICTED: ankyrin repeat and MYND domain-containing protein 1-like [Priapulus caudatus]|uniref:Ankyrin repeat and MYND domain-containing protein 1-like n=1 Tax=Priapulus caudatus TaxID=37621 RepID=A0ABM1EJB8_PRICU|nr:PREDICTED: ankyrin repeat and MYND domain-containing protein 1-like [Priapulus caudatus]